MKQAGWLLIAIATVVIFYNVVIVRNHNEREANDHPFSGGDLKRGYTFTPPYAGFEMLILAVGIGGIVLVVVGHQQQKAAEERRRREEEKEKGTSNDA